MPWLASRCAAATLLAGSMLFAASTAEHFFRPGRIRVLLLSGRNNHEWRATTPFLRQVLEAGGRFDTRVSEEPAGLTGEALAPYQALVVDYNGPRWGESAESAVEAFVRAGGGLVLVHAASYAFGDMELLGDHHVRTGLHEPPWTVWERMGGAAWQENPKSGHGQRHVFTVHWTDRAHPIAQGLPETFTANDEIYHQLRLRPEIHVLATAFDDAKLAGTGRDEPVLWTVAYGNGRVFHTILGHDVAAMMEAGFRESFRRGTQWAATGKVDPSLREQTAERPVRVTVVTGGHDHDASFYTLFEDGADIRANINPHPAAFAHDLRASCDVLVLYDLVQQLNEPQKRNLQSFVEAGKGVVLLHHSIADYNDWTWWWREVVGGRYLLKPEAGLPASTYKHDVEQSVTVVADHPVTRGLSPMHFVDETYKGMWISPEVKVLLRTDAATSDGPVAWVTPYAKSRVIYIQLGHDHQAHVYPPYRQLVRNAVLWAAGRKD